jgi:nucleotide-binding universal stress UspA family protein
MAIRTVLVPVDGSPESIETLDIALLVAIRFGAHIEAVHVVHSSLEAISHMSDRMPASLRATVSGQAKKDAREHADAAKEKFQEFCQSHGVALSSEPRVDGGASAEWIEEAGEVAEVLVRRGRLSDVIIVARPAQHKATLRRSPAGETLEAIMMGTGRPLLIIPPDCPKTPAKHVVIGWNESQESARALSLAMPWLPQMDSVTLAVSKKREARSRDVLDYLAWHGINAQVSLLDGKGKNIADSLLNVCKEASANILVIGGFSHSRARQLLFGGVTRHLLSESTIPTFMVH